MPTARRKCTFPGCTVLVVSGRCPAHTALAERVRGTRQERGYDQHHEQRRAWWQRRLDAGLAVVCWRCWQPIQRGEDFDLGHDDQGRHRGPEHSNQCNRSAGGRLGAQATNVR